MTNAPVVDAKLLDGAVVVQMLNPGAVKTFQEYADKVFLPYVFQQLSSTQRLDIIWDEYIPNSLIKRCDQAKRGQRNPKESNFYNS